MTPFIGAFSFKNIVRILSLVAVLATGFVGYRAFTNYTEALNLAAERGRQIEELYTTIKTHRMELARIETNLMVAEQTRKRAEAEAERYRTLTDRINNAKETENGAIAPVLRNTLDALRELR